MNVFQRICEKLDVSGVRYETQHHEPTYTSEQASRVRGVSLHSGAKALVLRGSKTKKNWLFVMPANLRLDSRKVQELVGERVSFAIDPETVTGCVKGAVPPFGSLIGLTTYCDCRLAENKLIHFNAGSLTDSITMRYVDYERLENPIITNITVADQ